MQRERGFIHLVNAKPTQVPAGIQLAPTAVKPDTALAPAPALAMAPELSRALRLSMATVQSTLTKLTSKLKANDEREKRLLGRVADTMSKIQGTAEQSKLEASTAKKFADDAKKSADQRVAAAAQNAAKAVAQAEHDAADALAEAERSQEQLEEFSANGQTSHRAQTTGEDADDVGAASRDDAGESSGSDEPAPEGIRAVTSVVKASKASVTPVPAQNPAPRQARASSSSRSASKAPAKAVTSAGSRPHMQRSQQSSVRAEPSKTARSPEPAISSLRSAGSRAHASVSVQSTANSARAAIHSRSPESVTSPHISWDHIVRAGGAVDLGAIPAPVLQAIQATLGQEPAAPTHRSLESVGSGDHSAAPAPVNSQESAAMLRLQLDEKEVLLVRLVDKVKQLMAQQQDLEADAQRYRQLHQMGALPMGGATLQPSTSDGQLRRGSGTRSSYVGSTHTRTPSPSSAYSQPTTSRGIVGTRSRPLSPIVNSSPPDRQAQPRRFVGSSATKPVASMMQMIDSAQGRAHGALNEHRERSAALLGGYRDADEGKTSDSEAVAMFTRGGAGVPDPEGQHLGDSVSAKVLSTSDLLAAASGARQDRADNASLHPRGVLRREFYSGGSEEPQSRPASARRRGSRPENEPTLSSINLECAGTRLQAPAESRSAANSVTGPTRATRLRSIDKGLTASTANSNVHSNSTPMLHRVAKSAESSQQHRAGGGKQLREIQPVLTGWDRADAISIASVPGTPAAGSGRSSPIRMLQKVNSDLDRQMLQARAANVASTPNLHMGRHKPVAPSSLHTGQYNDAFGPMG